AAIIPPTSTPTPEITPPSPTRSPEIIPPTQTPEVTPPVQESPMATAPTRGSAPTLPGLESIQIDRSDPAPPSAQAPLGVGVQLEAPEIPIVVEANDVERAPSAPVPV